MKYNALKSEKYVYIVFSATNLLMGRMIRFLTHNCYNHVSLAFERDLNVMYSFARYNINSPLVGGFVAEYPSRFSIKNRDVDIKVYKVPLTEQRYEMIEKTIEFFSQQNNEMIYNTFNAVLSLFHKRIRIHNAYTCVEFIASVLGFENVISIRSLENRLRSYSCYKGKIKNADGNNTIIDDYLREKNFIRNFIDVCIHFKVLLERAVKTINPVLSVNSGMIK